MSVLCPRCYQFVDKTCETPAEVNACDYMKRVAMHGISKGGTQDWDVETKHGLARAREWMERQIALVADGGTWILPRSMSIIRINKRDKIATRVSGFAPETSTQAVFESMGWKWRDEA